MVDISSKEARSDRVQRNINEAYLKACRERDELRDEVERLRAENKRLRDGETECAVCELWHTPGTCLETPDADD